MYSVQTICEVVKGSFLQQAANNNIVAYLVHDSRKIQFAETSLFFALVTEHNDGHDYLKEAYKRGIRNFIVSKHIAAVELPESTVILVENTLTALQQLARFHRQQFNIPVIGITGSNGKTIVKEWLYQLLEPDFNIVRSPRSYNSQIGVPLSVWQMNAQHNLALFEAGISRRGEMKTLADIIQPTLGILTNIGEAHSEGFISKQQKLEEKLSLFQNSETVIGNEEILKSSPVFFKSFTWSEKAGAGVQITAIKKSAFDTLIELSYQLQSFTFSIPFIDDASVQNSITCCCVLLQLNYSFDIIKQRFSGLHAVDMRLQLRSGINHCVIINDSYSADLTSLHTALNFLQQQNPTGTRTVILSDFFESRRTEESLYRNIAAALMQYKVRKVVAIGEKISELLPQHIEAAIEYKTFKSTDDFIQNFRSSLFKEETILIKGARRFRFERIAQLFDSKVHQTVLEISLNALAHNLKQYQNFVKPETKVMAMVKAFAYGSGGAEIASVLQYHNADYLGVAYTDEGVELRKAGITLPIMVMNADAISFEALVEYNLQPVIYSFDLLQTFEQYIKSEALEQYPVHIEIETGMNRLGFALSQVEALSLHLASFSYLKVETVFSHLAASEDSAQDDFTRQQADRFLQAAKKLNEALPYSFLKHISNSAAIIRHPHLQMDMVRLGIGLYGVESDQLGQLDLQPVATLRSTIAQLKYLKRGETVSYNRRGIVNRDSIIATIRIGYADGFSRRFSNGKGRMWVAGKLAPVIGSVCMDMTMIDVTDTPQVREGDEVILFGAQLSIQEVAAWIDTIPYEIMTSVSQRVKRIYFQE